MPLEIDLTGRRALVTGGGQNVGRGIAQWLGDAGAEVLVNDLVPERTASVADEITGAGGRAVPAVFDVTDYDAVRAALDALGPVDILVNNAGNAGGTSLAGGFELKPFVDTTPDSWERYIRINFYGVMHCVHAAMPAMIDAGWGRIVTIISDASRAGDSRMAAYAGAKAAAAGFTRTIAREGGRHGITANCISLGSMENRLPGMPEPTPEQRGFMDQMLKPYIVRRQGTPDDVAATVCFLASEWSSWVTGQTIPVNGGYTLAL
jgi:3-oxoacyl-[acyl-carrier protein] reductase